MRVTLMDATAAQAKRHHPASRHEPTRSKTLAHVTQHRMAKDIGQGGATWRNPDKAGAVGELHRVADARRSHKPSDKRRVTLQNGTACERKQKPAPEHRNRGGQEDPASPVKKARPRRRAEDVDSQTREGEQ